MSDNNQGTFGILDQNNWMVCQTIARQGTRKTEHKVRLVVDHWSCPSK